MNTIFFSLQVRSFIEAINIYVYTNLSVLECQYAEHGDLLSVVNKVKTSTVSASHVLTLFKMYLE